MSDVGPRSFREPLGIRYSIEQRRGLLPSTRYHRIEWGGTRILNSRSISNHEKSQESFFTLPLLCYNKTCTENESRHLGQNEMAGLKGKSGPPGNMNAFKHGLAAIQKR